MSVTAGTLAGASVIKIVLFLYSFFNPRDLYYRGYKKIFRKNIIIIVVVVVVVVMFSSILQ